MKRDGCTCLRDKEGNYGDVVLDAEPIGSGSYCEVYKATQFWTDPDEEIPYAVKVYDELKLKGGLGEQRRKVEREIDIWGKLNHENVIKSLTLYESSNREVKKFFLRLQLADLG